jgi:hypothetical protein
VSGWHLHLGGVAAWVTNGHIRSLCWRSVAALKLVWRSAIFTPLSPGFNLSWFLYTVQWHWGRQWPSLSREGGKFLCSWEPDRFSRRTLLRKVNVSCLFNIFMYGKRFEQRLFNIMMFITDSMPGILTWLNDSLFAKRLFYVTA